MATAIAHDVRAYTSRPAHTPNTTTWVQLDLATRQRFERVRLYPFSRPADVAGQGFPVRFCIACSDDASFNSSSIIADWKNVDYPNPGDHIVEFPADSLSRYVRITAFRLGPQVAYDSSWIHGIRFPELDSLAAGKYVLCISKIEVLSGEQDIALHCHVSVDETYGNPKDALQLTRSPRPQGEGLMTDNPENVIPTQSWNPVLLAAQVPRSGVRLGRGVFQVTMNRGIAYLLGSHTIDDLLYEFRNRVGRATAKPSKQDVLWDGMFAGSGAGRFLMGAGNALRWIDHRELRRRMYALVDGIAECRDPDGYMMAYPKETISFSERGAYTRAWLTHGLIEAGNAGLTKAFDLLRGYYDWYNEQSFLPVALRGFGFGPQGTVANTRMYFTPVGKPKDLHVVQRYLQENYLLERMAKRDPDIIWKYPYDRPHCYIITFMEAYLDLYIATGWQLYLDAVLGAWDLFRENWQYPGGSFSISEGEDSPPKSNSIYQRRVGELCGNAFWIALNQRLHTLFPEREEYVSEIEKSIYNVVIANITDKGVRYHTRLVGRKEEPMCSNTCCEGQGSRIMGSLPEYIYSVASDGIFVNLFEESEIDWRIGDEKLRLTMHTRFPISNDVSIDVHVSSPVPAKIRVRVPGWSTGSMSILVNAEPVSVGLPGRYVTLDRTWKSGDSISFRLLADFALIQYEGADQVVGRRRFSLEYGPILMAAVTTEGERGLYLQGCGSPEDLLSRLRRNAPDRLSFSVPLTSAEWKPYYELSDESFTCFPIIECDFNVGLFR